MINEFDAFIRSHGYEPKSSIEPGRWVRFGRKSAVSAKLYDDALGGYLHDWRTGEHFYWFANRNSLNSSEYEKRKAESELLKQAQEAKRMEAYTKASVIAEKLFREASDALSSHGYLARKQVKPFGIKQVENNLLIPIYSVAGDMQSIQFIDELGNKKFLKNGKVSGGCHFIGQIVDGKPIYIAEGYATAASVCEDTKSLTIVAFNAANLITVAKALKSHLPDVAIVIAGDADPVGKRSAEAAANAVGGKTLIPCFDSNKEGYSDWNDYFNFRACK